MSEESPTNESTGTASGDDQALILLNISEPEKISCQEDLKAVALRHGRWMDSVLDPRSVEAEGRANFKGVDLSGMDLKGLDFRCANFSGSNLRDADLRQARLSCCDFSNAILIGANFSGSQLKRANFLNAEIKDAVFDEGFDPDVNCERTSMERTGLTSEASDSENR